MKANNFLKSYIVVLTAIVAVYLFFAGCTRRQPSHADCKSHLRNALVNLNDYYRSNKTSSLQKSLENANESVKCPETRRNSIDIKISVLELLGRYQSGYEFIDSLKEDDFHARYMKKVNYNYFRALDYESNQDTTSSKRILQETISDIQIYINKESLPADSVDEDAYLNLFMIKKKLLDTFQIGSQIDSLKKVFPKSTNYFNTLRNTILENASVISQKQ
jgi:hypothetical protein